MVLTWFQQTSTELNAPDAALLQTVGHDWYAVEVNPPRNSNTPATLDRFTRNIMEIQSKWLGLRNASPITAFGVRRPSPEGLRFQCAVPRGR
jgi:hypothetical protein